MSDRWYDGLLRESTQPPADAAHVTRCLFVVGADYGELALAMYFLLGQPFAHAATLLLPPGLHATNADALPGRTRPYRSLDGIIEAIDTERPDVVLLLSGYLLSENGILSLREVAHLVGALDARGCRLVTSDPFLGLAARMRTSGVRALLGTDIARRRRPWSPLTWRRIVLDRMRERRLHRHLSGAARLLERAHHLYPSPAGTPRGARDVAFFNACLIESDAQAAGEGPAYWTFILGAHDVAVQAAIQGHEAFLDALGQMLRDTVDAGRDAVLVAPADCVAALRERMPGGERIWLLSHCSFTRFAPLTLRSEFVFYWNLISASMALRLLNERPVFILDRGHFARSVRPIHDMAIRAYFHDCPPPTIEAPLDAAALEARARDYRDNARIIREGFARAPSPVQCLERILEDGPAPQAGAPR